MTAIRRVSAQCGLKAHHAATRPTKQVERRNRIFGFVIGFFSLGVASFLATVRADQGAEVKLADQVKHLKDFQVVEFRRYLIKKGQREHFAQYFESYFPEAFQQLGAIAAGSFFERQNPSTFTWLRGFHAIDDRATINAAFYYGPLWQEHKSTMNDLMLDSDNVLLLQAITPERSITILPAVDPVLEANGAQGIVIAQIFAVKTGGVDAFGKAAEATFAAYRAVGIREAGVLTTLEVKNNFPQLPVRTDGPYLVWIGILKDNDMLENKFYPLVKRSLQSLEATGLLQGAPELVVMDPTRRSRLRWWPPAKH